MNKVNKRAIKEFFRGLFPNIRILRKMVSKKRIDNLMQVRIPKADVQKAELGLVKKDELLVSCKQKWHAIYNTVENRISEIVQITPVYADMEEQQKEDLKKDMLFCRFAYGFIPAEYVCYRLDIKNAEEREAFISERDHVHFYYKMNDIFSAQLFNDKMKTYEHFRPYYKRDIIAISSDKDFEKFHQFVSKHVQFVKKEVYLSSGKSVEKIDMASCGKTERALFDELISHGKTILEECVVQNKITEAFNSSSVNTVRCITFNMKDGIIAPYCFMKVGRKGSFVDNGGAGGILVGIDAKTGIIDTRGIDELHREYDAHPDSNVVFQGTQFPEWDKMLAMCKEMSSKVPNVKYIGWDLAYTDKNEWVVIEGNGLSQFIGPQTIWQRGIKREVEGFMRNMDLMN